MATRKFNNLTRGRRLIPAEYGLDDALIIDQEDPISRSPEQVRADMRRASGDHIGALLAGLHVGPGEVTLDGKKFVCSMSESGGVGLDKAIKQVARDHGFRGREIDKFYGRAQKLIARRLRNPDV